MNVEKKWGARKDLLPPDVAERLRAESARRKGNGEVNWSICAIIREAINRGLPQGEL